MRNVLKTTGFSGLALTALVLTSMACGSDPAPTTDTTGAPTPGPQDAVEETIPTDPSETGDPTSKDTPSPPLVNGVAIQSVAFFQAVKVPVVTDGAVVAKAKRNAPVVANRPALVRVYVSAPKGAARGTPITAELRLVDGTTRLPVLKDTKTITAESTDATADSTFNFEVPATSLPPGVTYQVLLTAKDGTVAQGANDARFPKDGGVQDLDVETSGKLKLVIVPVRYDFDGSGRMPDVGATQLARYKETFMARYPATEVEVTAREPIAWTTQIAANGSGFSQVLNAVTQLRRSDQVSQDVYYYGAFVPMQSMGSFCGRGCVTGLSTVVQSARSSLMRASVGVGFAGQESVNTAAHEIGHAHGRSHAPCGGAQGVDPSFPYESGAIGTWGYNILSKTYINPTRGRDMMGYCPNEWVSDYTFKALFVRIAAVNAGATPATGGGGGATGGGGAGGSAGSTLARPDASRTYRMATVAPDGSVTWDGAIDLDEAPTDGNARTAVFVGATGETVGEDTAQFFPYDHLPGGVLIVPATPRSVRSTITGAANAAANAWTRVHIAGVSQALPR